LFSFIISLLLNASAYNFKINPSLTDVEEGGETRFNKLGLSIKPKKGRALVWPSVLDENPELWDSRMYHEAKDVIKGEKRAANHWIHLNDYITPNDWGCTGSFS